MDARPIRALVCTAAVFCLLGANYRTKNFVVQAPTAELAREAALTAERLRKQLALDWLGRELPPWRDPCPVKVHVGPQLGAGGVTSFLFDRGRPYGWSMTVQGSWARILDSVLPHEITHTIFATHFGRPLPRWADEGACTTVEHASERRKQEDLLITFLTTGRGIPFNRMFAMKEYPADILPLYSQGYALAEFLIGQGGRRKFVEYIGEGMRTGDWAAATRNHYGYRDLSELQLSWVDWVRRGRPPAADGPTVAAAAASPDSLAQASRASPAPVGRTAGADEEALVPVPPLVHAAAVGARPGETELAVAAAGAPVDSRGDHGGWYAAQRERAMRAGRGATDPEADRRSVTRPQPVGRPGQIILQWSSDESVSGSRPVPPPAPASWAGSAAAVLWR